MVHPAHQNSHRRNLRRSYCVPSMTIVPKNGYLLLKEEEKKAETASGIVLTEQLDDESSTIIVRVVAQEGETYTIGTRLLVKRYMLDSLELGKESFLLGKQEHVCAVLYD